MSADCGMLSAEDIHKSQDVLNRNLAKFQKRRRIACGLCYAYSMAHARFRFGLCQSPGLERHGHMLFLHKNRGMAKIQIVMAMTLDGYLPQSDETLMSWVKENGRHGMPYWQEKAEISIYPYYGMIDLMNIADSNTSHVYLAEVSDMESAEYARGLFLYNLVDEVVIYLLPLSYSKGVSAIKGFQACRWKLHSFKRFFNGVCRLVYRRVIPRCPNRIG